MNTRHNPKIMARLAGEHPHIFRRREEQGGFAVTPAPRAEIKA